MSERIRGSYDDALHKLTYTLVLTLLVPKDYHWKFHRPSHQSIPSHPLLITHWLPSVGRTEYTHLSISLRITAAQH